MKGLTFKKGRIGDSLFAHSFFKSFIVFVVMMIMTTSSASAEVIDGLCYDLNSDTKTATLLPKTDNEKYSGDIIIPEKVKGNDGEEYVVTEIGPRCFEDCSGLTSISIPSSVTLLGEGCFWDCSGLTSITIPSSVTSLEINCFSGCSGLTSITIPSSVTSLGKDCFSGCKNIETIYFKGELPRANNYYRTGIPYKSIIKVPSEYLQDYKKAFGSEYKYIFAWNPNESGDGDKPATPCATPSVSYELGEFKFACETAGAKYHYTISSRDMATDALSEDGKVSLSAAYHISVYATADGYTRSQNVSATLYWINANIETKINPTKTRGIVASAHDGIVSISGLDNGEIVNFYAADGKFLGSSSAAGRIASCAVSEKMVIAKIGKDTIKVLMK